jgi:hypothetical protein
LDQYCHRFEIEVVFDYLSNDGCGDVVGEIANEMGPFLWEEVFQRDRQNITFDYPKSFGFGVRVVLSQSLGKLGVDFNGNHTTSHTQKVLGKLPSSRSYFQNHVLAGQIRETNNFLAVVIVEEMLSPIFKGLNFFKQ